MRRTASIVLFSMFVLAVLSGCSGYNKILKASDYNTKYSLAKTYFVEGRYTTSSSILEECVAYQRGTAQAEESMYLLATCYYNLQDYLSASQYYLACYIFHYLVPKIEHFPLLYALRAMACSGTPIRDSR